MRLIRRRQAHLVGERIGNAMVRWQIIGLLFAGILTGCRSNSQFSSAVDSSPYPPYSSAYRPELGAKGPSASKATHSAFQDWEDVPTVSEEPRQGNVSVASWTKDRSSGSLEPAAQLLGALATVDERVEHNGQGSSDFILAGFETPASGDPDLPASAAAKTVGEPKRLELIEAQLANATGSSDALPDVPPGESVVTLGMPYGVGPDADWLRDNVSVRIGATSYSVEHDDAIGFSSIVETTKQCGDTPYFFHLGGGSEYLDGDGPMVLSAGASRLATIEGDYVSHPLILGFSYDAYFDRQFFGTDDSVLLDQIRVLAGWALSPRMDVGAWGAKGLRSDRGTATVALQPNQLADWTIDARLSDRVAAYIAKDTLLEGTYGSRLMVSAGYEDTDGKFFAEADTYVSLCEHVSVYIGMGYSASGAWDGNAGVEIMLPGARWGTRTYHAAAVTETADGACEPDCDPCVACDPCGVRYRGGTAYGVYRSALRAMTPSRMRRMMEYRHEITPIIPPSPGPTPGPTPSNCLPDRDDREVVPSRLSDWLENNAVDDLILPGGVPSDLAALLADQPSDFDTIDGP